MQLLAKKKVGALGRLLLPSSIRKDFGMFPGATVGIYSEKGRLVLRSFPEEGACCFCNKPAAHQLNSKGICKQCLAAITKEGGTGDE